MKSFSALKNKYWRSARVGWFLAFEQIRRSSRGTTTLIIFIMVLTFLNLVVVSGLLLGLITGSFGAYRNGFSGEVIVTPAPGRDYIENSPALEAYFVNHPKVSAVSARRGTGVTVVGTLNDNPKKNERPNQIGMRLSGIDLADEEKTTGFSRFILKGSNLSPDDGSGIILGATMLQKYSSYADANIPGLDFLKNVDVGSRVRVVIARDSGNIIKEYTVRGIVKSKIDEVSTRAFVTADEMNRILPSHKEDYAEIAVRTDYDYAGTLAAQARAFNNGYAARIQTSDEAIPSFLRDIENTMSVLGNALSSIALVVASITVFIVIYINAVTKRKYIGIMKGIGISPNAILFSYILQALFYGIVGSAIGLVMTFGVLKPYFDANPINFPFSDGILVATAAGAGVRVTILLLVTLVAGYVPAKLIVRRNTLDAILGR